MISPDEHASEAVEPRKLSSVVGLRLLGYNLWFERYKS